MSILSIFYAIFFVITLTLIGVVYILGCRSFKENKEYKGMFRKSINNSLRITGIVSVISLMLINSGLVGESTFTFLCIPFFMIIMYQWSCYFRIVALSQKVRTK